MWFQMLVCLLNVRMLISVFSIIMLMFILVNIIVGLFGRCWWVWMQNRMLLKLSRFSSVFVFMLCQCSGVVLLVCCYSCSFSISMKVSLKQMVSVVIDGVFDSVICLSRIFISVQFIYILSSYGYVCLLLVLVVKVCGCILMFRIVSRFSVSLVSFQLLVVFLNIRKVVSRDNSSDRCWVMLLCMMLVWVIVWVIIRKIVGRVIVNLSSVSYGVCVECSDVSDGFNSSRLSMLVIRQFYVIICGMFSCWCGVSFSRIEISMLQRMLKIRWCMMDLVEVVVKCVEGCYYDVMYNFLFF